MDFSIHPANITIAAHLLITISITVRVIMKRPATGVALAWLFLVAMVPFAGALIYLLIGERRVSPRRSRRIESLKADYKKACDAAIKEGLTDVDWSLAACLASSGGTSDRTNKGMPTRTPDLSRFGSRSSAH